MFGFVNNITPLRQPKQPPVFLRFRSSKWLIGFTAFVAAFTVSFRIYLGLVEVRLTERNIGWLSILHGTLGFMMLYPLLSLFRWYLSFPFL